MLMKQQNISLAENSVYKKNTAKTTITSGE